MCVNPAVGRTPWQIAHNLPEPWSPFPVAKWRAALTNHPDRDFVNELLHDITHGVDLGYTGTPHSHCYPNHLSTLDASEYVITELTRELDLNRMAGPFLLPPSQTFVGSPIGAVPKKRSHPLKFRIIHDLSWPRGQSINEYIPAERFRCQYDTLDRAIALLKQAGKGARMAKLDLSDAYRHVLVRPQDWGLLGASWPIYVDGELTTGYFVNMFLPFGARSSPAQFLRFASALNFVSHDRGANPVWNYMDDFFTCDSDTASCTQNLDIMISTCEDLGFSFNPAKLVRPTTCLTLLGIEIDSVKQETRIDSQRLADTLSLLEAWRGRSHCTRRQLQSLLGTLNFICNVCRPGRTFMRRLLDLLTRASSPSRHIRLTRQSKLDIMWWASFLPTWNGKSIFYDELWSSNSSCHLFTDACNTSFGAFFDGAWFCDLFANHNIPLNLSIAFKELYAITAALAAWAPSLRGKRLMFHCDNETVVHVICKGSSTCPNMMGLLRYIFFVCASNCLEISATHIPGYRNNIADALSRLQVDRFRHLAPQAARHPTTLPTINWSHFK